MVFPKTSLLYKTYLADGKADGNQASRLSVLAPLVSFELKDEHQVPDPAWTSIATRTSAVLSAATPWNRSVFISLHCEKCLTVLQEGAISLWLASLGATALRRLALSLVLHQGPAQTDHFDQRHCISSA